MDWVDKEEEEGWGSDERKEVTWFHCVVRRWAWRALEGEISRSSSVGGDGSVIGFEC